MKLARNRLFTSLAGGSILSELSDSIPSFEKGKFLRVGDLESFSRCIRLLEEKIIVLESTEGEKSDSNFNPCFESYLSGKPFSVETLNKFVEHVKSLEVRVTKLEESLPNSSEPSEWTLPTFSTNKSLLASNISQITQYIEYIESRVVGLEEEQERKSIRSQLETSRNLLKQIGELVENISRDFKDELADPIFQEDFANFRKAYDEGLKRLENPSLRIVMVGTTSSGKSTIVNALTGHKLAPMERAEMSAGILTVRHAEELYLEIAKGEESSPWETGRWEGLNESEIYARVKKTMGIYNKKIKDEEKKSGEKMLAPQIIIGTSLLPVCDRSLLNLPKEISLEFIDIPGLKHVTDCRNLETIQEQTRTAFSLVALDFLQLNEENRLVLFKQLREIIDILDGQKSLMLFVLNRVDLDNGENKPIEIVIRDLQEEIKKELGFTPTILPLSALPIYLAQNAWGSVPVNTLSLVEPNIRIEFLKNLIKDCSTFITKNTWENEDLDTFFGSVKKQLKDNVIIDDETVVKILSCVQEWSGCEAIWGQLRNNIQEHFYSVVILPPLINVFKTSNILIAKLNSQEKLLKDVNDIEDTIQKIEESKTQIDLKIKKFREDTMKQIQDIVDTITDHNPDDMKRIISSLDLPNNSGLQAFIDSVEDTKKELITDLIIPLSSAMQDNWEVAKLKIKLEAKDYVHKSTIEKLVNSYDKVTRLYIDNPLFKKGVKLTGTKADKQKYDEYAEKYSELDNELRTILVTQAKWQLQLKTKRFQESILDIVKFRNQELSKNVVNSLKIESLELDKAVLGLIDLKIQDITVSLHDLKAFSHLIKPLTKTAKERYFIFWEKETFTIEIPSPEKLTDSWSQAIDNSNKQFWDSVKNTLQTIFNRYELELSGSVDKYLRFAIQTLNLNKSIKQEDRDRKVKLWEEIHKCTQKIEIIISNLLRVSKNSNIGK